MSSTATTTVVFLILTIWVVNHVESATQQAAPAPAVDCGSVIMNLADCLSFVTAGSTVKKPEGTCCSGLKTVLKTNADCLCETFKNSAQLGVSLNTTKALSLPSACHLSSPSFSNCGLSIGAGPAPAQSPVAVTPSSQSSLAPSGITFAPEPVPGSSGSSMVVASAVTLVVAPLVAVAFSLF